MSVDSHFHSNPVSSACYGAAGAFACILIIPFTMIAAGIFIGIPMNIIDWIFDLNISNDTYTNTYTGITWFVLVIALWMSHTESEESIKKRNDAHIKDVLYTLESKLHTFGTIPKEFKIPTPNEYSNIMESIYKLRLIIGNLSDNYICTIGRFVVSRYHITAHEKDISLLAFLRNNIGNSVKSVNLFNDVSNDIIVS